jgi:hypothetical protein
MYDACHACVLHVLCTPYVQQLWLGGSPNQTRLAKVFAERADLSSLLTHAMPPSALPAFSQLWLGGSSNQTRLAKVFAERVNLSFC